MFYYSFTVRSLAAISGLVLAAMVVSFLAGRWTADGSTDIQLMVASAMLASDQADQHASDGVLIGRTADTFTIQIGTFRSETNASHLASDYESKGYQPYVLNTTDDMGTHWFSVRLCFYHDEGQARQVADQFWLRTTAFKRCWSDR